MASKTSGLLLFCCGWIVITTSEAKLVDMTYNLANVGMSFWPGHTRFHLKVDFKGPFGPLPWLTSNSFVTTEHIGSHIDAPYHVYKDGLTIDKIPLDHLHGPAVVVDIRERAKGNRNALVYKRDLIDWEAKNGKIPDNAFILMNSGWGQFWGNQLKYVGTDTNRTDILSHPGFSGEAVEWLQKERSTFRGIGVDTVSCDTGNSTTGEAHVVISKNNKICIENVAHVEKIPVRDAQLFLMPILVKGGSGAPVRLYAMVNERPVTCSGSRINVWSVTVVAFILFIFTYMCC